MSAGAPFVPTGRWSVLALSLYGIKTNHAALTIMIKVSLKLISHDIGKCEHYHT